MSGGRSGVHSTLNQGSGGQPVWNEDRAASWLANADARERQLQPVSDALFERASLQPGERVLDVGVGSGPTTSQAWQAVRPDGSVTGIDIAAPMINAARQRITAPEIEWIVGDAAAYDFPPGTYDAVISRFGVMFFADPPAAFRNLCEATRPGGQLIVTVWSLLCRHRPLWHSLYGRHDDAAPARRGLPRVSARRNPVQPRSTRDNPRRAQHGWLGRYRDCG